MKKNFTIYELSDYYMYLLDIMSDPDAENTADEILEAGVETEEAIQDKADGYAKVMSVLEAQAAAIKDEEARLAARRKVIENNIKRMKLSLQQSMEMTGMTKFKTALFSFGIQNNPASVVLDCKVEDLPQELIRYAEPVADKKAIMDILKSGADFPFAHLEQTQSLRIR